MSGVLRTGCGGVDGWLQGGVCVKSADPALCTRHRGVLVLLTGGRWERCHLRGASSPQTLCSQPLTRGRSYSAHDCNPVVTHLQVGAHAIDRPVGTGADSALFCPPCLDVLPWLWVLHTALTLLSPPAGGWRCRWLI